MRIGAGSFAYCWWAIMRAEEGAPAAETVFALVDKVRAHGLPLIQICDNVPLDRLTDEELRTLGRRCAEGSMELQIGSRGTDPEHLLAMLRRAELCGATLVRTMLVDLAGAVPTHERARENLRQVIGRYARAGIRLGLENHDLHRTAELAALLAEVDDPALGICLDTVNSFAALETPDAVIAALLPRTCNIHLKDFTIRRINRGMGFAIEGAPTGEGRLNLQLLREAPAGADAVIELWPPFQDSLEETVRMEEDWVRRSLANLARLGWR